MESRATREASARFERAVRKLGKLRDTLKAADAEYQAANAALRARRTADDDVAAAHKAQNEKRMLERAAAQLQPGVFCPHRSVPTADGYGAYCKFCGKTLE